MDFTEDNFTRVNHMDFVYFRRWLDIYKNGFDVVPTEDKVKIFAAGTKVLVAYSHSIYGNIYGNTETFHIQTEAYNQMKQVKDTLK